jgi:hypothetical protein
MESRDLTGAIPAQGRRAAEHGCDTVLRGALTSSVRGSTTSTGPGSTSAETEEPSGTSVFIICAARQHYLPARVRLRTSIGSRW